MSTTRPLCVRCQQYPQHPPYALCVADLRQLKADEDQTLDWDQILLEKPRRGSGKSGQNHEPDLPLSTQAQNQRHRIRALLMRWRITVIRSAGVAQPVLHEDEDTPRHMWWLRQPIVRRMLLAEEFAADYANDIHFLAQRSQEVAAPDRREGFPIGFHRPRDDSTGIIRDCGKVWATAEDQATCSRCEDTKAIHEWRNEWPERAEDELTVGEGAAMLAHLYDRGVKERDVRDWMFRENTTGVRKVKRGKGVRVYRGDLIAYANRAWSEEKEPA